MIQINIVPHRLKRDARLAHRHHLVPRLVHGGVAPSAQVEPEAPERLPGREADQRAVLLDRGLGRGAREEVEVERPAEEAVLDQGDGRGVRRLEERV